MHFGYRYGKLGREKNGLFNKNKEKKAKFSI